MGIKNGLLMMVAGVFLTFAWSSSTPIFDPRAFGVALLIAAAFVLARDISDMLPRRRWMVAFDRPGTVLPVRHHD